MQKAVATETDQKIRYKNHKEDDKNKIYVNKVYQLIKQLNKKYSFKKSLDVGCADGSFSSKLKTDFNLDTHGIDISPESVKTAIKNGIKARVHNVRNPLPYQNNTFDLLLACEIIEHIYDTDFFIKELHRVLTKNGILIITTPNLASLANRIRILFGKYPTLTAEYSTGRTGHIRAYTLPVLINQLKHHGLTIISKTSPNLMFPMVNKSIPHLFKKIAIKLGDIFPKLGSHLIIVSTKKKRDTNDAK